MGRRLGTCAFCDRPTGLSFGQISAARLAGEPLFCDEVCRAAGEQLREKVTALLPRNMDQALCRHRGGTVGGRCLDCAKVVR